MRLPDATFLIPSKDFHERAGSTLRNGVWHFTMAAEHGFRARALRDGVICYLSKPFDEDALLGCISAALNETIRFQVTHAHCALS